MTEKLLFFIVVMKSAKIHLIQFLWHIMKNLSVAGKINTKATLPKQLLKVEENGEEASEQIIKQETGIDVDLSPMSPEEKNKSQLKL